MSKAAKPQCNGAKPQGAGGKSMQGNARKEKGKPLCVCCCCLGLFCVVATVGPLLTVGSEVNTCIEETVGKPFSERLQVGHCKQFFELKCPEALKTRNESARLRQIGGTSGPAADEQQLETKEVQIEKDCMVLQAKCECDAVTAIMATEPHLSERLPRCCANFERYEDHAIFGDMAKRAGDTCHRSVSNLTEVFDETADNCTKGEAVLGWSPQDLAVSPNWTDLGGGDGIAAKFSMLEDVWQPSTAIANKVQPLATVGAGVMLLAAAMGLRRCQAGGGRASQGRRSLEVEISMPFVDEAECVE